MVVRSQGDFEIREEALKSQVYASLIFVFILGAGAGWLLIRQVMRPVRELSGAVRQRAEAESWAPLDPGLMTEDEVGELARICDEALKRFHEALQRERTFTRDASHELRTPLTVIETSAELLELAALPEAQRRQVERILRASADMRGLITVFLQLARAPSLDPNRMPSDTVAGILSWSAAVWKPEAERRGSRTGTGAKSNRQDRGPNGTTLRTPWMHVAHAAVCRGHIGARRADHLLWRHRPHVRARQRCADHAATMIRRYE